MKDRWWRNHRSHADPVGGSIRVGDSVMGYDLRTLHLGAVAQGHLHLQVMHVRRNNMK